MAAVVPAHTRDAAFQLFCDLRANTPKDSKFVARHVRAFVPLTGPGWLVSAGSRVAGSGRGRSRMPRSAARIQEAVAVALWRRLNSACQCIQLACCRGVFACMFG